MRQSQRVLLGLLIFGTSLSTTIANAQVGEKETPEEVTPSPTPTEEPTPLATATPTESPTTTPTGTPTVAPTETATPTATLMATATPTIVVTETASPTPSPLPTETPTATVTPTLSPTASPTEVPTSTPVIPTPTSTAAPTSISTPLPPVATSTPFFDSPIPSIPTPTPQPTVGTTGQPVVVARVIDGDTVTVVERGIRYTARLAKIDAPHLRQSFGQYAKRALSRAVLGKVVRIVPERYDSCGDLFVRLYTDRATPEGGVREVYVNAQMVRGGAAWVQAKGKRVDAILKRLEVQAKRARKGLWSERNPIAPWRFSKAKQCGEVAEQPSRVPTRAPTKAPSSSSQCGGKTTCGEMSSCQEAMHYLNSCGVSRLDGDRDGIPCEEICEGPSRAPTRAPTRAPSSSSGCGGKRTCGAMSSCQEAMYYLNSCGVSSLDGDGDGVPCEELC